MNVIVLGEESQEICKAFLAKGHNAYSVDLQECSGGRPDRHIKGDMFEAFYSAFYPALPDLAIIHIECTYMCNSGALRLYKGGKKENGICHDRWAKMIASTEAFNMALALPCPKLALENPIMHCHARERINAEYSQTIQPYEYGHADTKRTCLWLKGLSLLRPTNLVPPPKYLCRCGRIYDGVLGSTGCDDCFSGCQATPRWGNQSPSGNNKMGKGCSKQRSKTYTGWAEAMAEQWG